MAREKYITFPIMMVLGTVVYLYYTTVFLVIDEWLGMTTAAGVANAALFSLLAGSAVAAYGAAALGDPGFVPTTYAPETEDLERTVHEFKRKSGDLRYCQKCSCYKPPRAHHCRVCRVCVLRMDHHCIWINNCVGHANYKMFVLSLVYAVVACLHSLVLLLGSLVNKTHMDKQGSFKTSYILFGLALISVTSSISILLGWHIYLIKQNMTTIEYYEGVRATSLDGEVGITYRHAYDLGVYENLASVMGPNVCCWLLPSSKHIGSGLSFRTSYDAGPSTLSRAETCDTAKSAPAISLLVHTTAVSAVCVLRMDHHCIWINNCVGHANYKMFILSLVYAVIACLHSLVLLLGSFVNKVHMDKQGSFRMSYANFVWTGAHFCDFLCKRPFGMAYLSYQAEYDDYRVLRRSRSHFVGQRSGNYVPLSIQSWCLRKSRIGDGSDRMLLVAPQLEAYQL